MLMLIVSGSASDVSECAESDSSLDQVSGLLHPCFYPFHDW